jgi:hypothetical protein
MLFARSVVVAAAEEVEDEYEGEDSMEALFLAMLNVTPRQPRPAMVVSVLSLLTSGRSLSRT